MAERILVKRSDKISFLGVKKDGSSETFNRMRGFTTLSGSKNPSEYSRKYVDEEFETTDVTGYSPSIEFNFDQYKGDEVHDEMVKILDGEFTGTEARRNIVTIDLSQKETSPENTYKAVKREYAIIGDADGDGTDAYTYGGTFRSTGNKIIGTATLSEDGNSVTFNEPSIEE